MISHTELIKDTNIELILVGKQEREREIRRAEIVEEI